MQQQIYLDKGCFLHSLKNLTQELAHYLHREEQFFLKHINEGDIVLDLGCGNGRASFYLARQVGLTGKVIAVDNNTSMIQRANRETEVFRNIEINEFDARQLPFSNDNFDATVIALNTLGNMEREEAVDILHEALRVTKPESYVLGTVYSENAATAQQEQYENSGLHVDKIDENYVHISEIEFRSERFSEEKLRSLLSEVAPNVSIERICPISYGFAIKI